MVARRVLLWIIRSMRTYRPLLIVLVVFNIYIMHAIIAELLIRRDASPGAMKISNLCSSPSDDFSKAVCEDPGGEQFDRFIIIFSDGFPRLFADRFVKKYEDHSAVYSVDVPGVRLSHAIFLSFFTGKPDVNFWALRAMREDNIFDSMFRSKFKVEYIGKRDCLMRLIPDRLQRQFENINLVDEYGSTVVHPYLFEGAPEDKLETVLNEAADKGKSLFFFSAVFDSIMHRVGHTSPILRKLSSQLEDNLSRFKGWVDSHPEYLLVFGSDHGFDGPGNLIHGHTMTGNDGFITFYNPKLKPQKESRMDVVDFAGTLMSYLKGADIPYDSVGQIRVRDSFSPTLRQSLLVRNYLQLHALCENEGKCQKGISRESIQRKSMSDLRSGILRLSSLMKKSSSLGMASFLSSVLVFFSALAFVIVYFHKEFWRLIVMKKEYIRGTSSFLELFVMFLFFLNPGISVWLWHYKLSNHAEMNVGMMAQFWTMILTFFIGLKLSKDNSTPDRITAFRCIVKNEFINTAIFILKTYVPDGEVAPFVNSHLSREVVYAIFIVVVFQYNSFRTNSTATSVEERREKIWNVVALSGMYLYELSSNVGWLYIANIHIVALLPYGIIFRNIGRLAVDRSPNAVDAAFDSAGLLNFFLLPRNLHARLWILVIHYQFRRLLSVVVRCWKCESSREYQLIALFLLSQVFHSFLVGMGFSMSANVDPLAGKVGLANFDFMPYFSAFLMGWSQIGVLFVGLCYIWRLLSSSSWGRRERSLFPVEKLLIPVTLALYTSAVSITLHEISWRYMMASHLSEFMVQTCEFVVIVM